MKFIRGLFSSTDRTINIVSLVLGTIPYIITLVTWKYPEQIPNLIIYRDIFLTLTLVFIIVLLMIVVYRRGIKNARHYEEKAELEHKNERMRKSASDEIDASFLMIKNVRDDMYNYFHNNTSLDIDMGMDARDYNKFTDICRFVANQVRASLMHNILMRGIDISEDLAISIKLILPKDALLKVLPKLDPQLQAEIALQQYWVITAFRDSYTYVNDREEREVSERLFNVDRNTAFHNIIVEGADYFIDNNLINLGSTYLNENPHWNKFYNSTLVVPIKYKLQGQSNTSYFGFIAADSKNIEQLPIFNKDDTFYILRRGADIITLFFLSRALYHLPPPSKSGNQISLPPLRGNSRNSARTI